MKKLGHFGFWVFIFFIALLVWAMLTDAVRTLREEHPLAVGLGIGIPVAILIFAAIRAFQKGRRGKDAEEEEEPKTRKSSRKKNTKS